MKSLRGKVFVATLIAVTCLRLCGQQDVTAKFPTASQVTADYPDQVQRWGAFNVLHQALYKAASKPMPKASYDLSFEYEAGYNGIVNTFIAGGAAQRAAYQAFNAQCDKLFATSDFGKSVLAKYHLSGLASGLRTIAPAVAAAPAQKAPGTTRQVGQGANAVTAPQNASSGPPLTPEQMAQLTPAQRQLIKAVQREIEAQKPARTFMDDECPYPQSFPLLFLMLIPVAFVTYGAVNIISSGRKILPTPGAEANGLPALPKELQVVSIPGIQYAVYALSGLEVQKEEKTYRSSYTETTPGRVVDMGGGHVQHTAPTTSTHSITIRQEIIWVRMPSGRENSWNLDDSYFDSRPGQVLSVLVRPLATGGGDIILIYNHTTGQMDFCPAAVKAHGVKGWLKTEFVQWSGNLACGVGSAIVTVRYIPMFDRGSLYAGFLVWWFVGALILVTASFLVVTPLVTSRVRKRREAVFKKKYFPGLRKFFEEGTPILLRTFGRG